MRAVIIALVLAGLYPGCADTEENSGEAVDTNYVADAGLLRVSGPAADGRRVVIGMPGALPSDAGYFILTPGEEVAIGNGKAGKDGAFAIWIPDPGAGPLRVRATRADGQRGADVELALPAGEPVRGLSDGLVSAGLRDDETAIDGLVGASDPDARVIVGGLTSRGAAQATADDGGSFVVTLSGGAGSKVVLFQHPPGSPGDASEPLELQVSSAGFPVLVSAAGETPSGVVILAPPGSVAPSANLNATLDGETPVAAGVAGLNGDVALCAAGLVGGDVLTVVAMLPGAEESTFAKRAVPQASGVLDALNPSFSASAFQGKVTVKGTLAGGLGYAALVNCESGKWTAAGVSSDSGVVLLLDAEPHALLALVGIGVDGGVGEAQFIRAGSVDEVPLPIEPLVPEKVVLGSVTDHELLLVGLSTGGGAALPHSTIRIRFPPSRLVEARAGADGGFVARIPDPLPGVSLTVVQAVGPFESAALTFEVAAWESSDPLPPVPGLVTVLSGSGDGTVTVRAEANALPDADLVLANLETGWVNRIEGIDGNALVEVDVPGAEGDMIGLFPVHSGVAKGSRHVIRPARKFDTPYLVSGAGALGCVVGPPGAPPAGLSVDLVDPADGAASPLEVVSSGIGWHAGFMGSDVALTGGEIAVKASGLGGTRRPIPESEALDASALDIAATPQEVIVSNGSLSIGSGWLLVFATPDGRTALARPPHGAPWTLSLDLAGAESIRAFAWHLPTGAASGCVDRPVVIDLPDPPIIDQVTPWPVLKDKPFEVQGGNLSGATVTIGGVVQPMSTTSATSAKGTVAVDTPLGLQQLVLETLGGSAELEVPVDSAPILLDVIPKPLVVGQTGTATGLHFGTGISMAIAGVDLPVVEASDSSVEFVVVPEVPIGASNLKLVNEVGSDTVTVEVTCYAPEITGVPGTVFLGDTVDVEGAHLLGAEVTIGGQEAMIEVETDASLTVTLPTTLVLGDAVLAVKTACGQTSASVVVATAKPQIDSVNPSPVVVRDKELNVYGDHLGGASVTVGSVAQTLTIDSKKGLSMILDTSTPLGVQSLVVITQGGTTSIEVTVAASPSIDVVQPDPVAAGAELKVFGDHLLGGAVSVGGVAATPVSETSELLVVTTSLDTPAAQQPVVVTTPAGTAVGQVTVIAPPSISETKPFPANPGKPLQIVGKNLLGASVIVAGIAHPVVTEAALTLDIVLDGGVPLGQQVLAVSTIGGDASATIAVVEGPSISEVTPAPLVVGKPYHLAGTNFGIGTSTVKIGGVVQGVQGSTLTTIDGTVATGTPLGLQALTLGTPNGVDTTEVTVVGPPELTAVSPNPVLTGEALTIVGLGLELATVTIGGVDAEIIEPGGSKLVVLVPDETPPGVQPVVVSTVAGAASEDVEVIPLPPSILTVSPDTLYLDEDVTISGAFLLAAEVTVGGVAMTILVDEYDEIVASLGPSTPAGEALPLVVTTPGGSAQGSVDVSDGTPPVPPEITSVEPSSVLVGGQMVVTGLHLKGAQAKIGSKVQLVTSSTDTGLTLVVALGTPPGPQVLTITTAKGEATWPVTILTPQPTIDSTSPIPGQVGQPLTVEGLHLAAFTSVTLGGVLQNVFYTVTDTKLVFVILPQTPHGPAVELVITTPGGVVTSSLALDPAPLVPPKITGVSPQEANVGETITVTGNGLVGADFTIGGVPHLPLAGGSNLIALLVIDEQVLPGTREIVASKEGAPPAFSQVFVKPNAPIDELVYISAVGLDDQLAVVGLPGAVASSATVTMSAGFVIESLFASDDGSFGVVLTGVSAGVPVSVAQVVEGSLSPPVERFTDFIQPNSPVAPHPFLLRVEAEDGQIHVFGPAPTFGHDDAVIVAFSQGEVEFATALELHEAPTTGMYFDTPGDAGTLVSIFAAGADPAEPASQVVSAFAVLYDPPLLSSAVADDSVCLAGLAGSVAGATLTVGLQKAQGSGPVALDSIQSKSTASGTVSARALLSAGAPVAAIEWFGTAGSSNYSVEVPNQAVALPAAALTATKEGAGITVTVLGQVFSDELLVAATAEGISAGAYGDEDGNASLVLPGSDASSVWVWSVSLVGGGATGCTVVSL